MAKTRSDTMTDTGWNVSFWVAVLSPVLGMVIGFLAVLLLNHWTYEWKPHALEIRVVTIPSLTSRDGTMESMPTGLCEVSERFVPEWLLPQRAGRRGRSRQSPA